MKTHTIQDIDRAITTEEINEIVKSDRTPRTVPQGKLTARRLLAVKSVIGDIFNADGLRNEWMTAIAGNKLLPTDILVEKFGADAYAGEWKALHKSVQDAFRNAGKATLADEFATSVPVFTEQYHPIDFIATLLHGPNNVISRNASKNAYSVLEPFKDVMVTSLLNKGMGAPPSIDTLTQVFYNTYVAGGEDGPNKMNFDTMKPAQVYHAEDDVIKGVVTYLKSLADKKQAGVQLTSGEDRLAAATIKVSEQLTNEGKKEIKQKVGDAVLSNTGIIIGIAVGALILYLIFK